MIINRNKKSDVNQKHARGVIKINSKSILLFITGFIGFSALSNRITSTIGLPYLIELYFIPIYYYNRKRNIKLNLKPTGKQYLLFLLLLVILAFSTFMGIINTMDPFNVVTCIRPFVYMLIVAYACSVKKRAFDLNKVYIVITGAMFGELCEKVFFMSSLTAIDHINTMALALFVLIPFVTKNKSQMLLSVAFGLFMAVLTMYRRELVVYACALFMGLLYSVSSKRNIRKIITLTISGGLFYVVYSYWIEIMTWIIRVLNLDAGAKSYYTSASYRLIEKFLQKDNASDALRENTYKQITTTFIEKIIPPGPIGKAYGESYFGFYTDSTNVFFYDVFGSLLSWIVVFYATMKAGVCFVRVLFNKIHDQEVILSALMVPVFAICLIIDGTFLVHVNISILAGYAMHGWFKSHFNNEDCI